VRVDFIRIKEEPSEFELLLKESRFKLTLTNHRDNLVLLRGALTGRLDVECFRCGSDFEIDLDENFEFLLSCGVYVGGDQGLDVVEQFDQQIDLDGIFSSEIELIRSDYHSCLECS